MRAALLVLALLWAGPAMADGFQIRSLRVCADPDDLPFSNRAGEGYHNKIAQVLSAAMRKPLEYSWYPYGIGFVGQTLLRGRCDVVLGDVRPHERILVIAPYMRAGYALVAPAGVLASDLTRIDDPQLAGLTIGVVTGSPPATHLAHTGRITRTRPYRPVVDKRHGAPVPQMLADLQAGATDAIFLWWPVAAHVVRGSGGALEARMLEAPGGDPPLDVTVGFAVRRGEEAWANYLGYLLDRHAGVIASILAEYGIEPVARERK